MRDIAATSFATLFNVVARIFGVPLAALAVQFMLDGLEAVGLVRAAHPVPAPPGTD